MVPTSAFAGFVAPNSCRAIETTRSTTVATAAASDAGRSEAARQRDSNAAATRQAEVEAQFRFWGGYTHSSTSRGGATALIGKPLENQNHGTVYYLAACEFRVSYTRW